MSGWSDCPDHKEKTWGNWYSNPLSGNLYRPRTEVDYPDKVRTVKEHTGYYGWTVEPWWHRKITGLCLDILEIAQRDMPEGWPQRVQMEAWTENLLELAEEVDESDWKKFEDRMKLGPVEYIIMQLEEMYTDAVLISQQKAWATTSPHAEDQALEDARIGGANVFLYGVPEYDEILSDDEKTWVKEADAQQVAAMHEKQAETVYHTTASTEVDLRAKILERRKRKLTEPVKGATSFGNLGAVL